MVTTIETCPQCGDEFLPAYRGQTECSSECRKEATKKPPKRYNRPPGFVDPQPTCRVTGCMEKAVHQHHVITRNHIEDYGGDIADPRDALGLCELHHSRHHKKKRRIRRSELRKENLEFARELMGPYADDHLARHYDMDN